MKDFNEMTIGEIAEYLVEKYPSSNLAKSGEVQKGCCEDWYEYHITGEVIDFFSSLLGFCGCGCPENTYDMLRKLLRLTKEYRNDDKISYDERYKRLETDLHLIDTVDTHRGVIQFIMYVLNDKKLLEHGSSVGGSWLTDLGKVYLRALDLWYDWYHSEDD